MIDNLIQGTDDYPCDCVHNNVANGSFTKVTPDLKYADLITCGKCNFSWYSNKEGMFDYGPCPGCNSTSPIAADLNQKRLAQASTKEKVRLLRRVLNAPFTNTFPGMPSGTILDRPRKRK